MSIEHKIYELAGITTPEERLFREIKTGFRCLGDFDQLRSIFRKGPLNNSGIIAVRTVDILTFLPMLLQGKISVDYGEQEKSTVDKPHGWFFTTATPLFYGLHPDIPLPTDHPETLADTIDLNNDVNRLNVLGTCFSRTVVPLLKPNWKSSVDRIVAEYDDFSDEPFPAKYEIFVELLFCSLSGENQFEIEASQKLFEFTEHEFADMIRPGFGHEAIVRKFLQQAYRERGGVVIGFNEKVLQGDFVTRQTEGEQKITHEPYELVIKPREGVIDLKCDPIVTVLPMGKFEKKILGKLGL